METSTITKWNIDKAHSEVQFKAKHLVISTVTGQFNEYDAWLETEGDSLENARAKFEAEVASITTNSTDRDNHLKSEDFFDAANHPKITFESTEFRIIEGNTYEMIGNMNIRGISRQITLQVEYGGSMVDPWGNTKSGFEITGKLNRHDYGLKWNAVTEAGGIVVGEYINLSLNMQMAKS
jgi:polyisoprenoid-binding protein YceI